MLKSLCRQRAGSVVIALIAAALLMSASGPSGPLPVLAQSDHGVPVRMNSASASVLHPSDIIRGADYGTFAWYELRPEGIERLEASGKEYEIVPGGTEISVNVYRFDPLVAEPEVDLDPDLLSGAMPHDREIWLVQLSGPVKGACLCSPAGAGGER